MTEPRQILIVGANDAARASLHMLLAEKMKGCHVAFADEADIPEGNQALAELCRRNVPDLDVPRDTGELIYRLPRQSKGERKRNKRNRWK